MTYSDDVLFSAIINILNVTINWVLGEWKVSCFLNQNFFFIINKCKDQNGSLADILRGIMM